MVAQIECHQQAFCFKSPSKHTKGSIQERYRSWMWTMTCADDVLNWTSPQKKTPNFYVQYDILLLYNRCGSIIKLDILFYPYDSVQHIKNQCVSTVFRDLFSCSISVANEPMAVVTFLLRLLEGRSTGRNDYRGWVPWVTAIHMLGVSNFQKWNTLWRSSKSCHFNDESE